MTGSRNKHSPAALALAAAMLVSWASPGSTATVTRKGTIKVIATITLSPSLPANAVLSGSADVSVTDFSGSSYSGSAFTSIPRAGNSKVVTIAVPYVWVVESSRASVTVVFSIGASTSGNPSAQAVIAIPLPPDGAVTEVRLPLTL